MPEAVAIFESHRGSSPYVGGAPAKVIIASRVVILDDFSSIWLFPLSC
jgi:hypothetical protein